MAVSNWASELVTASGITLETLCRRSPAAAELGIAVVPETADDATEAKLDEIFAEDFEIPEVALESWEDTE